MVSKLIADKWADLPVELLGIISGGLGHPSETVRFRSVCRSWRFSTPPPPNKLSPSFPLRAPPLDDTPCLIHSDFFPTHMSGLCDFAINASAVYFLRPRSDPYKAWLVSLQESAAGKLVLRDALMTTEMDGGADLESAKNWISATQSPIARSYSHKLRCTTCRTVISTLKVVSLCESSGSGSSRLVGLSAYPNSRLVAFRVELGENGHRDSQLIGDNDDHKFHDFVKFNGRFFAVDFQGHIYLVDHTDLQLIQLTEKPVKEDARRLFWIQFVVSDGDLYLVCQSLDKTPPCQIHKLVMVTDENKIKILIEQVENLGDKVFFISSKCSFSISARLLPRPWKGNCVFIDGYGLPCSVTPCRCIPFPPIKVHFSSSKHYQRPFTLFHLGGQNLTSDPSSQGYSDLLSVDNAERNFRMGVFEMGVF